jgi:hypothetical protein
MIPDKAGRCHDLDSSAVRSKEGLVLSTDFNVPGVREIVPSTTLRFGTVPCIVSIRNHGYDRLVECHFPTGFSLNRYTNEPPTRTEAVLLPFPNQAGAAQALPACGGAGEG